MNWAKHGKFNTWVGTGTPWVWLSAGAVSISLVMVFGLLGLIAVKGLSYFWPHDILEIDYREHGTVVRLVGEIHGSEELSAERLRSAGADLPLHEHMVTRYILKTGNRDILGADFRTIIEPEVVKRRHPEGLLAIERREWGNLYGYLHAVKENGVVVAEGEAAWDELQRRLSHVQARVDEIHRIEKGEIGGINYQLERLRIEERSLDLEGRLDAAARADLEGERAVLQQRYEGLQQQLEGLYTQLRRDSYTLEVAGGERRDFPLDKVVRVYRPNAMSVFDKTGHYFMKLWEFVSDEPREANTEGGIFPAIFGTVMLVIIMSVFVTPFGVVAAVYLREYARQGPFTRLIRIAVNNLAGVPAIVYGVFGLGFFVYFLGGNIDQLFYPQALPAPTFGTPGILWSSLTLAILTLPVVIVATEEGLTRVPRAVREGSLALGATKAETLWRVVLPMASPALMTGLILAVARAAGEVAPLMLVGVVKLAPSLPLDGDAPYLHLDRKFMHLGFHIFDVGFQSPNVEAARPLVYATAFLLVVVILVLNLAAVAIRNRLREKYRALES